MPRSQTNRLLGIARGDASKLGSWHLRAYSGGFPSRRPLLFCIPLRAACETAKAHQEKKTPLFSRPGTETRFALGSGGVSDWNRKPGCSADQLIVAPVLRNVP